MGDILHKMVIIFEENQISNPEQFQISNVQKNTARAAGGSLGTWHTGICLGFRDWDLE
jgi:hypothetical protein